MASSYFGRHGGARYRGWNSSSNSDLESFRRERPAVRGDRRSGRPVDHIALCSGRMENAAGGLYTFSGLRYCEAATCAAIGKTTVGNRNCFGRRGGRILWASRYATHASFEDSLLIASDLD